MFVLYFIPAIQAAGVVILVAALLMIAFAVIKRVVPWAFMHLLHLASDTHPSTYFGMIIGAVAAFWAIVILNPAGFLASLAYVIVFLSVGMIIGHLYHVLYLDKRNPNKF